MTRHLRPFRKVCLGLLTLAAFGALPGTAAAAGMGFRNDLMIPVIVQGESVGTPVVRRGPPLLIYPRKAAWDTNLPTGKRLITIYDARQPTRVLGRFVLNFDGNDIAYSILPVPTPPNLPPRVRLEIITLP
jgi:hypothetical protein